LVGIVPSLRQALIVIPPPPVDNRPRPTSS
jgi:hypothetical protein